MREGLANVLQKNVLHSSLCTIESLPINVKYSLVDIEGNEGEHPFDKEMFDALLLTAISKKNNSVIKIDTIKCLPQVNQVQ